MKNKTEKDCNGIEGKIFKKIKNGDISWVPFAREEGFFKINNYIYSIILDEKDNISNQVKKIEDRINVLLIALNFF